MSADLKYRRTLAYMWRGQMFYARQAQGESDVNAVVRAIGRKKLGPVTLWWNECRDGHDIYTAKWFDEATEVFEQCEVML